MITFPKNLTATYLPGYFWDVENKELYSIKIGGVLKKLKRLKATRFMKKCGHWYYRVSHEGNNRYLPRHYLLSLTLKDSEIPFSKEVFITRRKG